MSFDIASLSRAGGRTENEDYADFLQTSSASCWVLADGLGGHRGGATAAKAVVEAALASFRDRPEATADAIRAHIAHAQATLGTLQASNPALANMRSTIVILVSTGRSSVWGHLGDSRLYHLRGGQVVQRTRDHSVSQALVDVGQIASRDQGAHEDRSRLLRCLGKDDADAGATISGPHPLARGDAFLLCTDGFWEALDAIAIALDYAGTDDASGWLERMEARLRRGERPSSDNYTAIAIRLMEHDGLPEAPPHDPRRPARAVGARAVEGQIEAGECDERDERDERHERDERVGRVNRDNYLDWARTRMRTRTRTRTLAGILLLLIASLAVAGVWKRDVFGAWMKRVWTHVMPSPSTPPAPPASPAAREPAAPTPETKPPADVAPAPPVGPATSGAEPDTPADAGKKSEPGKKDEPAKKDEPGKSDERPDAGAGKPTATDAPRKSGEPRTRSNTGAPRDARPPGDASAETITDPVGRPRTRAGAATGTAATPHPPR